MRIRRLFVITRNFVIGLALTACIAAPVGATTVVAPDFNTLVRDSDYVVRAVVKSITTIEKAKPGKRPLPYSLVELEVKEVIIGEPPSPLVLEVLGGRIGARAMFIDGAPRFQEGQESIFFVQGNHTQIFPLTRMMHGLYPIVRDKETGREYVTRSNGEPMTTVAEVSEPMHAADHHEGADKQRAITRALSAADFATQIRNAKKGGKSGAK